MVRVIFWALTLLFLAMSAAAGSDVSNCLERKDRACLLDSLRATAAVAVEGNRPSHWLQEPLRIAVEHRQLDAIRVLLEEVREIPRADWEDPSFEMVMAEAAALTLDFDYFERVADAANFGRSAKQYGHRVIAYQRLKAGMELPENLEINGLDARMLQVTSKLTVGAYDEAERLIEGLDDTDAVLAAWHRYGAAVLLNGDRTKRLHVAKRLQELTKPDRVPNRSRPSFLDMLRGEMNSVLSGDPDEAVANLELLGMPELADDPTRIA